MAFSISEALSKFSFIVVNNSSSSHLIAIRNGTPIFIQVRHFLDEIQEILARCGMGEIYIVNPYECFILMCLLTDCPLAVFSEIWEKSYEEGEEKN